MASRGLGVSKTYLISDTHFNHAKIATYCDRPTDFTERLIKNCIQTVKPEDLVICLGDVFIGPPTSWNEIWPRLTGSWVLVRGNHDRNHSHNWWMTHGFVFSCDSMIFRHCWLTHEPARILPAHADINIHGHLHNIWHGFHPEDPKDYSPDQKTAQSEKRLQEPWQRLFAIEYTNYRPVDFDKFVNKPDQFQARGPNDLRT
jgi:calcineurin-like phosphoesterase family protein